MNPVEDKLSDKKHLHGAFSPCLVPIAIELSQRDE
jgi:hypothetical protein